MRLKPWFQLRHSPLISAALALAGCVTLTAWAQGTTPATDTRPPAATSTTASKPAAPPKAPRQRIELPANERQALETGATGHPATAPTQSELVPSETDAKVPPAAEEQGTRIEQVRTSNRISEIRVTPALTGRTYTIINREGRQPTSATETSSGLSVPKFFTFEWGRTDERPAPTLPPPPPSSTSR